MENKTKEAYMYVLGAVIVIGFFSVLIFKIIYKMNAELEIGALISMVSAVVGYFYGSSKGSADKNEMLRK